MEIQGLYYQLETYLPRLSKKVMLPAWVIARRKNAAIKSTNCSWNFLIS